MRPSTGFLDAKGVPKARARHASTLKQNKYFGTLSTLAILPERLLFVGKFRWKLPSNGTGIFFGTENRNGIELCHLQNTSFCFLSRWSLALVIQTNGTENLGRFGKNGKQVILLKRYCFFSGKLPPGWTALFIFFFSEDTLETELKVPITVSKSNKRAC